MATSFRERWVAFARDRNLPADDLATMPFVTVAAARRDALEFFSYGAVHQSAVHEQLAELTLDDEEAQNRD